MSTKIEWTDETWNPVTGCTKVSQGCKNCYALRLWPKVSAAEAKREGSATRRPFTDVRLHRDRIETPLKWRAPRRVFVNSMSDLFHESVSWETLDILFAVMLLAEQHTFQVLTKRPRRMHDYFAGRESMLPSQVTEARIVRRALEIGRRHTSMTLQPYRWPLPNVWLGVSVEDQETADERIPLLLQTPATVRFISAEPLLGRIDLWSIKHAPGFYVNVLAQQDTPDVISQPRIDQVIAGGESGPNARPSHPDWFRELRDACVANGVAFFFKQWGEWAPDNCQGPNVWQHLERPRARWSSDHFEIEQKPDWPDDDNLMFRLGKKIGGRELDGRTHDEYPA